MKSNLNEALADLGFRARFDMDFGFIPDTESPLETVERIEQALGIEAPIEAPQEPEGGEHGGE